MFRLLLRACLLSCLASTACKGKDKSADGDEPKTAEPKTGQGAAAEPAEQAVPESAKPVEPDLALIDATLEKLGDATVAVATAKGLPSASSDIGIACGNDPGLAAALKHIGFASAPLKPGKGFLYQDVCVGWRPYITPATEIYWMISAGAPTANEDGEAVMPVRRCLQVIKADDSYQKVSIADGPCLTMHRAAQE